MTFRTNVTHWEIMIAFMEKNKDFAKGFVNGASGKDRTKKLWEELTIQLNSAGFGERTIIKWQKTWTDFKHLLKKKAAGIKVEINATGGGPPQLKGLTDIENRILCILGPTFYKGIGRPENGVRILQCNKAKETENFKEIQLPNLSEDLPTSSESSQQQNFEIATSTQGQTPRVEAFTLKRPMLDHDYLKAPMTTPKRFKSKSEEPMEAMYKETITELREIKGCLQDVTNCLKGVQSALDKIADHKCNKKQ